MTDSGHPPARLLLETLRDQLTLAIALPDEIPGSILMPRQQLVTWLGEVLLALDLLGPEGENPTQPDA